MQSSLGKRNVLQLIESPAIEKGKYYLEPKKKIKPLKIEISDAMAEECEPLIPSTSRGGHPKIGFNLSINIQSTKSSTSSSPHCSDRSPFSFNCGQFMSENATTYDNFYKEEEFYNVAMRKCHRRYMEDRAIFETPFETRSENSFFGIYDGHRNSYVSDFLQKNLHKMVLDHPELYIHPEKAIKETFYKIDQDVCRNQEKLKIQGGSTALCALMNNEGMHLANVGDSKAVVIRGDQTFALNVEHRANNEEEKSRVENRGGVVFEKKGRTTSRFLVQGALELTRSIGDISYKQFITSEPDVLNYKFDSNDEYVILASDGFWNEVDEKELISLVRGFGQTKGLSSYLVEEVLKRKHYNIDNITLIVIDLKRYLELNTNKI